MLLLLLMAIAKLSALSSIHSQKSVARLRRPIVAKHHFKLTHPGAPLRFEPASEFVESAQLTGCLLAPSFAKKSGWAALLVAKSYQTIATRLVLVGSTKEAAAGRGLKPMSSQTSSKIGAVAGQLRWVIRFT